MAQNHDLQTVQPHRQSASAAETRNYFFQKIQAIVALDLPLLHTVFTEGEDNRGRTKIQFLFNLRDTEHAVRLLC